MVIDVRKHKTISFRYYMTKPPGWRSKCTLKSIVRNGTIAQQVQPSRQDLSSWCKEIDGQCIRESTSELKIPAEGSDIMLFMPLGYQVTD